VSHKRKGYGGYMIGISNLVNADEKSLSLFYTDLGNVKKL
jgi:hypothetical protein